MGCICINEKAETELDDNRMQEIRKSKRILIIVLFKF
jgi:hypothetical protein